MLREVCSCPKSKFVNSSCSSSTCFPGGETEKYQNSPVEHHQSGLVAATDWIVRQRKSPVSKQPRGGEILKCSINRHITMRGLRIIKNSSQNNETQNWLNICQSVYPGGAGYHRNISGRVNKTGRVTPDICHSNSPPRNVSTMFEFSEKPGQRENLIKSTGGYLFIK